jgi:hypothetical protein
MGDNMYILKLKGLKQQLQSAGLSERERYQYLLGWMVLGAVAGLGAIARQQGFWPSLDIVVAGVISIASVWYAYRRNGAEEGTAFLDRFMSLGFVISIRQVIIIGAMMFLHQEISYLLSFLGYGEALDEGSFDWIGSVLNMVPALYFLWAIGRHMADIRGTPYVISRTAGIITGTGAPVDDRSSRRLERFVEAVVQRETAEAQGVRMVGAGTARPKRRIIRRRSARR